MHKIQRISLFLITACTLGACDDTADHASRSVELDLQRFGIDQVVAADGAYEFLDADGLLVGTARGKVEATDATLHIELADQAATLSWSPQDLEAACIEDGSATSPDDGVDACASAITVAARLAEAEGSTPPFAADDDEFRLAPGGCTTVSTWVGGSSCSACRQEAEIALPGTIVGGTCSSGWIYTTCQYTAC